MYNPDTQAPPSRPTAPPGTYGHPPSPAGDYGSPPGDGARGRRAGGIQGFSELTWKYQQYPRVPAPGIQ